MRSAFTFAVAAVALVGCTSTFRMSKVDPDNPATRIGLPYDLLMTQYEVELTRRVVGCGARLEVLTKAEVKKADSQIDAAQMYSIDTEAMGGPFKISDFKAEYYPGGRIKSLNAAVEDRTAAVVANIVGGLGKVASIAAGAGAANTASGAEVCTPATLDALDALAKQKPQLDAANGEVERWTTEVARLKAKVTAMGGAVDPATARDLSIAIDALEAAQRRLVQEKRLVEGYLGHLTHTETVLWPENGDVFATTEPFATPTAVFDRWAKPTTLYGREKRKADVHMRMERIGSYGRDPSTAVHQVADATAGLPFRRAARGRLVVCSEDMCTSADVDRVLAVKEGAVVQLGHVYQLPFRNRPFQNTTFAATFTTDGEMSTAGTAQKAASAEGATGAFKDGVATLGTTVAEVRGADTARLTAEAEEAQARRALADAQAALVPVPADPDRRRIEALALEAELAEAETRLITARETLAAARTRTMP